jgi:predicted ATPase
MCRKQFTRPEVRKEAESYGIALRLTSEEARALFEPKTKNTPTLPVRGTSFIGRDVELTELATLLNKHNVSLLTLLGTAGVGKTRLALQLALEQQTLNTFSDGIYFIPLESLSEVSFLPSSLLNHLGLSQQGNTDPTEQLINVLATKHCLLVLDNFEHLTAGAVVLSLLLSNCPNLKILVTSRETLRLEEEHVFALEGLPFPTTFSDEALLSDAVQLFKERAQQFNAQFELDEQLTEVIRICQLVEGLPLGIELAASWVRMMSWNEIAKEIERGLESLSSTAKNIPERHRSLKAAFEYSWKLLTIKEQEVLRKLSVFHGGFRRETASNVAGATIPVLASLLDKSLLRITPEHRYTFHPLLQNFTREKLDQDKHEEESIRERHGRYYLGLLESIQQHIRQGNQKVALGQLNEDFDNAVAAWQWASDKGISEELLKSVGAFRTYFTEHGRTREGKHFFARAIEQLSPANDVDKRLLARLMGNQAWYCYVLGDFAKATELAKRCLELSTSLQDTSGQFAGANVLACVFMDSGEYEQARHYSRESLSYARAEQDIYLVIPALINLGSLENELNNLSEAEKHYREALALCNKVQDFIYLTATMNNLAFILKETNRLDEATKLLEESLAMSRPMNLRPSQMYAVVTLAMIYDELGQVAKSMDYAREGLEIAKSSGATMQQSFIEELIGKIQDRLEVV